MRKNIILSIFCFISLLFTGVGPKYEFSSSIENLNNLVNKFESYASSIPIEKVYLHIDKPFYFAGEDVWFKAYILEGMQHKMKPTSDVLYTEIYNSNKELILKHKLNITDGYAIGDFKLEKNLPQDKYLILAYTNGMKNFDQQFFFHRYIDIFNSSEIDEFNKNLNQYSISSEIDLQFFPEGGYLIENIPSQLAFKAINSNGNSIDIKGEIYNQHNILQKTFQSNHLGMGKVIFTPKKDEKYYALIKSEKNNKKYDLPEPLKQGYVLSIDNTNRDYLFLNIHTNIPSNSVWIVGQCRGKIYYAAEVYLNETNNKIEIPKLQFPSGIIQFTLFDHKKRPFSERLVFIKNETDFLNLSIIPNKSNYAPREKVELQIKATDQLGVPQKANLSISVTDYYQVNSNKISNENIFSYLLLTSELKENIENPAYYFIDENPERLEFLDNLLMTQGWRKFSWQNAIKDEKIPCNYAFEKGIVINGKIEICPRRYPVDQNSLIILALGDNPHTEVIKPLPDSTFSFNLPNYSGKSSIIIQSLNKSGKYVALDIKIDSTDLNNISYNDELLPRYYLSKSQKQLIREKEFVDNFYKDDSTEFIEEVAIVAKRLKPQEKPDTYRKLPDGGIYLEKIPFRYQNVLEYLQHKAGVILSTDSIGNRVVYLSRAYSSSFLFQNPALLVIDDIPLGQLGYQVIRYLPPSEVLYIDILKGAEASFYGARGSNGVIVIYTKTGGGTTGKINNVGYRHFKLNGYYSCREYYCPNYDIPKKEHEKRDLRSSIYWNPNIQTDENGIATVTFYNSDRNTKIKAQIEGINTEGDLGFKEFNYEVSGDN